MNAPAQKPKFKTPFWQFVKYEKNQCFEGLIANKPYRYDPTNHNVFRFAGGWVLMTQAELDAKPYIQNTLSVEYSKIDSSDDYAQKRSRRRAYSVGNTRACNSRRV